MVQAARSKKLMVAMASLLKVEDVNVDTVHMGSVVPKLGLVSNADFEFRVYVLECAPLRGESEPTYYVGVQHKTKLEERLRKHMTGNGADYTKAHKPQGVAFVMPAEHRAAEAYVYYALMSELPAKSVQRLGGWTQTSVNPSPLVRLLGQEARRNMHGKCFKCGGDHYARECIGAPEAAPYPCKTCGEVLRVTARAQTPAAVREVGDQA